MVPILYQWLRTLVASGLTVLIVLVLILALEHLYFSVLPRRAINKYREAKPERLRRYLEWVVATPSLVGPRQKLMARGALAGISQTQGRHAEAVAHYRANLTTLIKLKAKANLPVFVALEEEDIRYRLADCLEALGEKDEADEERREAEACVARALDHRL